MPYVTCIQLYRYRTGTVLVPVARYQLVQYEAPTQGVRAVRGRVLEPSVLVETLQAMKGEIVVTGGYKIAGTSEFSEFRL